MVRRLNLPDSASVAEPGDGGRMFAPSAARNADYICDLVATHAPATGRALEIASGTGQHMAALAVRLVGLEWQPSDPDAVRRDSIDAHCAGLSNVRGAEDLDACAVGWGAARGPFDVIVLVNLLHLISTPEAQVLISEVGAALAPGGVFVLYGPFLRDGEATSEGDARFDAQLRAQDPEIGYKDDWDVIDWIHGAGLELRHVVEMPANNLGIVAARPV
ncbi:DUF938 domain-containing protein [Rhodalgimonas zhirmunskyi]|uniref:Class I SAM-dependent methyltransferase n=1 Tax=Rhodalgimonas zhirmunskyi TaxID=2964767 RepID=A0AAJ1UCW5_9RHOB|nr:DUF938 domain-containing protein [Rhodoalgimonas zhirmunskyi]MDQ2093567.1 class I SAM-dependent methyltransferase [Rhodoalgimonas zhirmunskyi]